MIRVIVVSDTHDYTKYIVKVAKLIEKENPDIIIHLGDNYIDAEHLEYILEREIYKVPGNCDYRPEVPNSIVVEAGDISIFASHGHLHDVKRAYSNLVRDAKENDCKIALYGHTHIANEDKKEGIKIFNPGSAAFPRGGQKRSIGLIEIENTKIKTRLIYI
ncbi:MAG: metallophosphoesterase [Clostridium sp.]|nr:metallophosphoesterase [Clostridium sp.]